ncbi:hypothetical protein J6590_043418 [Homalodisca vitripennis]|nr:hypothetical protein J6590_043418 [Homalodisca vitripennis]
MKAVTLLLQSGAEPSGTFRTLSASSRSGSFLTLLSAQSSTRVKIHTAYRWRFSFLQQSRMDELHSMPPFIEDIEDTVKLKLLHSSFVLLILTTSVSFEPRSRARSMAEGGDYCPLSGIGSMWEPVDPHLEIDHWVSIDLVH